MHWDFALILIFLGTAVPWLGRRRIRQLMAVPQTTKKDRLVLYASTCIFQWLAVALILWRVKVHHIAFRDLGVAVPNVFVVAVTTFILGTLVFANQIFSLRRLASRPAEIQGSIPQLALKVFPQDNGERWAFFALVATVAVCEEFIYRGFIQHVFEAWAGDYAVAGAIGSAIMFSLAHLYQGKRGLISTFVIGGLFSVVRYGTGSLLPPLVAHFVADLMAGLLAPKAILTSLESARNGQSDVPAVMT
jgi:membrane protease YdiL (CAAX protease family)